MEKAGIYVHIPFCLSKCGYCNFFSVTDKELTEKYLKALTEEIGGKKGNADSIFFGGGTPTVMEYKIIDILSVINKSFIIYGNSEITVEANPETVTKELLTAYWKAGINRISFGVQSFCDNELAALSRIHTAKKAKEAVILAKEAGFTNINIDLMLNIPFQTEKSLLYSLDEAVKSEATHISIYSLKLEKGTPMYSKKDSLSLKDEDAEWEMYKSACEFLRENGFWHYEISNFAREGFECRHNLKYWTLSPYIGFGVSAHSYYGGKRFYNASDFDKYFKKTAYIEDEASDFFEEYIMLGLRLSDGISIKKALQLAGKEESVKLLKTIEMLRKNGYANLTGDNLSLTEKGFWVSNSIITELLLSI